MNPFTKAPASDVQTDHMLRAHETRKRPSIREDGKVALVTLSQGRRIRWQNFPTLIHIGQGVANASRVCLDLVRGQYSVDEETSSVDLSRIGLPLPSARADFVVVIGIQPNECPSAPSKR